MNVKLYVIWSSFTKLSTLFCNVTFLELDLKTALSFNDELSLKLKLGTSNLSTTLLLCGK
jgi:hypothetical protein